MFSRIWKAVIVLTLFSLGQPAQAQDVIPPKMYSTTPGGINVSDGSFVYSVTDLVIGTLTLERYHLTGAKKPNNPLFGKNMSHNFDIYVASNMQQPSGPPFYFPYRYRPIVHIGQSASGVYAQPTSTPSSVSTWNLDAQRSGILSWAGSTTWSGGYYVYTDRNGAIYTFSPTVSAAGVPNTSQRVSQIAFPDGRVQTFSYDASQQLKLVSDSSGYAIVFDYNATGDVTAACGFNLSQSYVTASSTCSGATLKVIYGYDASGYLVSATGVDGQTTGYPTNTLVGVTCLQPPGYASCKMAMSYDNVTTSPVTTQVMADGSTWVVHSSRPDLINDPEFSDVVDGGNSGLIIDPAGKQTNFAFTKSSLRGMTDPNGRSSSYTFTGGIWDDYMGTPYSEGTMLVSATLPEGNRYLAEYLGPFRAVTKETMVAKPGSGLPDLVKEYGYTGCFAGGGTYQNCAKPSWIKDPKGNQTDFSYAPWGGTLWEMQPAPSAGAARPLKLFGYVQKYAYVKNSGGTLAPAAAPVWLPDTETQCQTYAGSSAATCDPAAPITVTTYQYGPNGTADNLLLRGKVVTADGVSLRTCYGYDWLGNQISETSPRAGLANCS